MTEKSIIFMGTPDIASESLKAIFDAGIKIKAVVTQEDKQRGRGRKVSFTDVKKTAIELDIPILQPVKMKDDDFILELKKLNADLFVVVAFRILPKKVIDIAKIGAINLHTSLLPNYRGAAPINHAIFNGDKKTGLSIFFLNNKAVDSGKLVSQHEVEILPNDNFENLYNKLKVEGAKVLPNTIKKIFDNDYELYEQDLTKMIHPNAPKIFPDDFEIDWNMPAEKIHNMIRGVAPKPGAFTFYNGKRLKILKSEISEEETNLVGVVTNVSSKKDFIQVGTSSGSLLIKILQPEGKKAMSATAFINGYKIKDNDKLGII